MKFSEKIKELRNQASITQKELGKMLGVSTVTIRNWEAGVKTPAMSSIIGLAEVFNVTTDYILGVEKARDVSTSLLNKRESELLSSYRILDEHGREIVDSVCSIETDRVKKSKKSPLNCDERNVVRYIPHYTTPSAAGVSVPSDIYDFEMIEVQGNVPKGADFAIDIQGDSMYPYINDGDTVYVKRETQLSNGDVGIFVVDGEAYCKQYFVDDDKNLHLLSANPDAQDYNVCVRADSNSNVRCFGRVLLDYQIPMNH